MTNGRTSTNLLFHVVAQDDDDPLAATPGAVTAAHLERTIAALLADGRTPARLVDYLGETPPGVDRFTISFDDAHPSVLQIAAPILRRFAVPATLFASTRHCGRTPHAMSWEAVRSLADDPGWDIGAHSARHERMGWRHYREDRFEHLGRITKAARESHRTLAEALGRPPTLFAYPFGQAPASAREAVRAAGFEAAFSVDLDSEWDGDRFGIPRLDGGPAPQIDDETPGISVVVPACDRVGVLQEVVRRLAEQSYPPDRHEILVVDDGSAADLSSELAPFVADDSTVRLLRLPDSDNTFRAGQARQLGADSARFDVLLFLDADVAVDRDFLWSLAWTHAREPKAVLLGYLSGYNLQDLGYRHELDDIAAVDRLTPETVPVIPDRSREPTLAACMDNIALLEDPWTLAYTGSLSLRRSLLNEAGGFARDFSGWGFEDVDLGVRLHGAGARWIFSRFAVAYHVADPAEEVDGAAPNNPFRAPRPERSRFEGVLANLARLERGHPGHEGVAAFCASIRADVDEICGRPYTVGVDVDGAGGFSLQQILDRVAYAERVGAQQLWVLGPGVAARQDLADVAHAATAAGLSVTLEVGDERIEPAREAELVQLGIRLEPR